MKTENSNNLTYIDEHNNYLGDFANCDNNKVNNLTTPDYSHLEYPPVFEPETYTLTEPSLNKIRRKNTEDNLNK